ncbi:MAG: response regulator [Thermodesulfobacteriota bacterium]
MTPELNILVVDDNEDLAINLQDILHEKGYQAKTALDGAAAINLCGKEPFDLVLLDYNLPDMDGLQVQKHLSSLTPADFIIVTGYASVESASAAVSRRQIVGYETKPLDVDRLLAFIRQVGDRRQAERDLQRSQARYRTLYEAITDALFVHPMADDGAMGRFTEVNEVACERYGYSREELLNMRPADIVAPETETDLEWIVEKLSGGGNVIFEQIHRIQNGGRIFAEVHANAFQLDGSLCVLSLVRDISERKQAEADRRQMENRIQTLQRMESLMVMAGGIAHDFNNILMVVIGNMEIGMDDPGLSPQALKNLMESKNAALRAADLVKQMLAYSGKGHFVVEPVRLNEAIQETAELLKTTCGSHAELKIRPSSESPVIDADKSQLTQIIMNLIINACESLDQTDGGRVTISTGVEICDTACLKATLSDAWLGYDEPLKEGRYAFLEVKDEGCGMDPETRRRIFEPFFSTKFQGRGLGLPSVLGIIRGHQGFIRVDTQVSQGTVIRVLLPVPEQVDNPSSAELSLAAREVLAGEGLILVVDDEPSVRRLIRMMLEKMGYEVITAADGNEAVRVYHARSDVLALIVMDLTMPGMGGVDTFQALQRAGCDIPVVLASGYSEAQLRTQHGEKGFAGFLHKPFQKQTLSEMLVQVLKDRSTRA